MQSPDYAPVEQKLFENMRRLAKKLPRFKDGRINYRSSKIAPVVTVFVSYRGKILLLKRSSKVLNYKGKWNTVAGYIDEYVHVRDKMLAELGEELGLSLNNITLLKIGNTFVLDDRKIGKKFVTHPGMAFVRKKPKVKLDVEHTEYRWIYPQALKNFDTVPKLSVSLRNAKNGKYLFRY